MPYDCSCIIQHEHSRNNNGVLQEDVECWVVGTFYKDMKLKPSILEEYTKDRQVIPGEGVDSHTMHTPGFSCHAWSLAMQSQPLQHRTSVHRTSI